MAKEEKTHQSLTVAGNFRDATLSYATRQPHPKRLKGSPGFVHRAVGVDPYISRMETRRQRLTASIPCQTFFLSQMRFDNGNIYKEIVHHRFFLGGFLAIDTKENIQPTYRQFVLE